MGLWVAVGINNKTIFRSKAINVSESFDVPYGKGLQMYDVDDGEDVVNHKYDDGALKLAIKVIKSAIQRGVET